MHFHHYRKSVPTRARRLTETDHRQRSGVIETLEGPKDFQVGDYLACDRKGEWPIARVQMEQHYQQVTEPDREGWADYHSLDIREAARMPHAFVTTEGLAGKPGDYLVRSAGREWPVDGDLFEHTYTCQTSFS